MFPATVGLLVLSGLVFLLAVLSALHSKRRERSEGGPQRSTENSNRGEIGFGERNRSNPEAMRVAARGNAEDQIRSARAGR